VKIHSHCKIEMMKIEKIIPIIAMLLIVIMGGCTKNSTTPAVSPTVTSTDPANSATNVAVSSKINANFSVAMDPATISTTTFTVKQGTTAVIGAVTYVGTEATFTPASKLGSNMAYTVTITTGAKNTTGTSMLSNFTSTFTTGTVATPGISSTDPAQNATNVAVNKAIAFTFSQPMNPASITSTTFVVKKGNVVIPGTVAYSGNTATFTPTSNLDAGAVYTASITSTVNDVSGTELGTNTDLTFTTLGTTAAPIISSTDPAKNATNVSVNKAIVFAFSQSMNPASITTSTFVVKKGDVVVPGTVTYSANTATFTPTNSLEAGATYTASLNSTVKDITGNELGTNNDLTFTTAGSTPISTVGDINLGEAGNYAILAKTAITNASTCAIIGNVGLSPAATALVTGFALTNANEGSNSIQVTGKIYAADMAAPVPTDLSMAVANMVAAYTNAAGRTNPGFSEMGAGTIGGLTLAPGLYKWTTGVTMPSNVTISGTANDIWIFQIAGDLNMSNAVRITLAGGAIASNIYWQVAGQATLGTTSHLEGNLMTLTGITFKTGASLTGRALSQTSVILDGNTITSRESQNQTGN
jgi:methionine-rich copper-binding protein CopC